MSVDRRSARSLTFEVLSKGGALVWHDVDAPGVDAGRQIVGELDLPRFPAFPREVAGRVRRRG